MRIVCRRFAASRDGNFSIIASLITVPLVMGVGIMLDLSTIARTRAELQQAADAAVLAVAREGKLVSDTKARQVAGQFLRGNFDPKLTKYKVARVGTGFNLQAETKAGIAFGKLFGYDDMPITAVATADIAYASYEIALVLDTTGSMKGGKLASMKDAVLGLLDTMPASVKDEEKLKFAIVPFASFVNVGAGFGPSFDKNGKQIDGTGAAWLDLKGQGNVPQTELVKGASRFQIYHNLGQTWPGCVETRTAGTGSYDTSDAQADRNKPDTLFVPAFSIDEPDTGAYPNSYITSNVDPKDKTINGKKKKMAKYGVATDAAANPLLGGLLTDVLGLLGIGAKTIPIDKSPSFQFGNPKGPGLGCEMQPVTALTSDYSGLKDKIKALNANGYTNILEGVSWGMRVLSPEQPFSEGKPKTSQIEKIMVVLTDGSNTFGNQNNELGSTYSSMGYLVDGRLGISAGGSAATTGLMNVKTLEACANAKADGIEVYTIRLEEPNVATGTMLKECASSPEHYFDVPSRGQLDDAFSKIKERIVRVRIAS
jgi:Flp pilus assembly protein TadG